MSILSRFSIVAMAIVATGFSFTAMRSTRLELPEPARITPANGTNETPAERRPMPVDIRGNEVMPTIAKYKLDSTGTVYEEHSPNTEVPKLAIPRS